jgi:hypothetical protein
MKNSSQKFWLSLAVASSLFALPNCSGGQKGDPNNRGSFEVLEISTGSTPIYPYRVRKVDSFGLPSNEILEINEMSDLKDNANGNNLVLPAGIFAEGAPKLPSGDPGNHFLKVRFSHDLMASSVLSTSSGSVTNSFLTTAVALLAYDSNTEVTTSLVGRGFVGGQTVINDGQGNFDLVRVFEDDGEGNIVVLDTYTDSNGVTRAIPAAVKDGFPKGFTNDVGLISNKTFLFVADTDEDLATLESFPSAAGDNTLIRIIISNAVLDTENHILEKEVATATTVGADNRPPDVLGFVSGALQINPGNNQTNVDPTAPILVRFNKPIQPTDFGTFYDKTNLVPSGGGATISVTIAANSFTVIYYADPLTSGDFCNYRVVPAYNLPGESTINFSVNNAVIRGLDTTFLGNTVATAYTTAKGPGIVNAPVAPDALYVGMVGSRPGIKIIDLNGFGQTTGGYIVDPSGNNPPVFDWRNTTRFQFNPNIGAPGLVPNLSKPSDLNASGLDCGSPGVFRLIQDSSGETLLLGAPVLGSVADIHIGNSLDLIFNNENINVNASRANHVDAFAAPARANGYTSVPHPNPPRLLFPPPNPSRSIFGEEPTAAPSCTTQPINLLVSGNPEGPPGLGLFGHTIDTFNGPAARPGSPPPPTPSCPFSFRQQIGHFLYVLDGDNQQILVVNSNRMTVLDTIRLSGPVDLAMSPTLHRLAVSNAGSGSVSFIDIDPTSSTFHQVTGETRVAPGPGSICWQPDGEDVLVVHPKTNQLSVINAIDLTVTKTASGFLNNPIGIACADVHLAPRGNATGLYFAYILNSNGTVAVFESGPDGVNGIGFNDIIGTIPDQLFRNPRGITIDLISNLSGVYISHSDEQGRGMVSRLEMTVSPGMQPLSPNSGGFLLPPTYRQKVWKITQTFGGVTPTNPTRDQLSGRSPGDICLDEMINTADLPNQVTPRNGVIASSPGLVSEKGLYKTGLPIAPKFLFIAIRDRGMIDVFSVASAEKVRTIDLGGVPAVVSSYWRQ